MIDDDNFQRLICCLCIVNLKSRKHRFKKKKGEKQYSMKQKWQKEGLSTRFN